MASRKPPLKVVCDIKAPASVLPWERALLQPLVQEFIAREFDPSPAAVKRRKIRATWTREERRFRDCCERHGFPVRRTSTESDGTMLLAVTVSRPKDARPGRASEPERRFIALCGRLGVPIVSRRVGPGEAVVFGCRLSPAKRA